MSFLIISYPLQILVTQENFEVSFYSYTLSLFCDTSLHSQDPLKMLCSVLIGTVKKTALFLVVPATENTTQTLTGFTGTTPKALIRQQLNHFRFVQSYTYKNNRTKQRSLTAEDFGFQSMKLKLSLRMLFKTLSVENTWSLQWDLEIFTMNIHIFTFTLMQPLKRTESVSSFHS